LKNKIFLFLGPPGSGKGTLSEMCVNEFGWPQLSTGNLCRQHIAQGTVIGKQIEQIIAHGQLVPDEIIATMVVDWIAQQQTIPQGIVFDGYPRTKNQAAILYNFLKEKLPQFELVLIKLNIDVQLLSDRILNRVVCANKHCARVYSLSSASAMQPKKTMTCDNCSSALIQRSDDTQESLKERLHIYFQHEQEIIDFYQNKGLKVDMLQSEQNVQSLFEEFKKIAL
jgi:adenylate kinase